MRRSLLPQTTSHKVLVVALMAVLHLLIFGATFSYADDKYAGAELYRQQYQDADPALRRCWYSMPFLRHPSQVGGAVQYGVRTWARHASDCSGNYYRPRGYLGGQAIFGAYTSNGGLVTCASFSLTKNSDDNTWLVDFFSTSNLCYNSANFVTRGRAWSLWNGAEKYATWRDTPAHFFSI